MRLTHLFYFLICVFFITACSAPKPDRQAIESSAKERASIEDQVTSVRTEKAKKATFTIQKLLNGEIEADRKTIVKAQSSGQIKRYILYEGKVVTAGDVLIQLDEEEIQLQLEQKNNALDDAMMAKNERIIRDGGFADQDTSVSTQKLAYIKILSGLNKAESAIKEVEYQLRQKSIKAPISGWITDIEVNDKELISAGDEICTIVDPSSFEIKIALLESDAIATKIGTGVTAYPLLSPDTKLKATVTKINPVVDENGLVTIYARIQGSKKNLFEGMNVRVELESKIASQIIVPKSALVSRSDRDVIFIHDSESGLAKWKYVTLGHENKDALAIIDGLEEGDEVIVEGNLNLDHDAKIKVVKSLVEK